MFIFPNIYIYIYIYNCSTWALSEGEANKLDVFQRKLIRQVLEYKWSDKISNNDLYAELGLKQELKLLAYKL